jgi:hypothetical protein
VSARLAGPHRFVAYLTVLALGGAALSLPFSAWRTFVTEAHFGFNRTSLATWLGDRARGLALQALIGVPILYAVYGFMRFSGAHWWLWLFAFLVVVQVLLLWAWPTLIAPLFNRFQPLPEGPLRERLGALSRLSAGLTVGRLIGPVLASTTLALDPLGPLWLVALLAAATAGCSTLVPGSHVRAPDADPWFGAPPEPAARLPDQVHVHRIAPGATAAAAEGAAALPAELAESAYHYEYRVGPGEALTVPVCVPELL